MKAFIFFSCLCIFSFAHGQTLMTRNGYAGFFSKTPLEDIRAENRQVNAVVDLAKQNIAVALLVKGFLFRKELMQQHFNENYAESDQYPKATCNGKYSGDVDVLKEGAYPVIVNGDLTFHGVTKKIQVPAVMEVKDGKLWCRSTFQLVPGDFNIKIPSLVKDKIARQIDVSIRFDYPLSK